MTRAEIDAGRMAYRLELQNKFFRGRLAGQFYVVTRPRFAHIVARFETREEAVAWIEAALTTAVST